MNQLLVQLVESFESTDMYIALSDRLKGRVGSSMAGH
jgi:hypothetical protein